MADIVRKSLTGKRKNRKKKSAQDTNRELVREAKRKLKGGDTIRNIVIYCTACGRKAIDTVNNEDNRFIYKHEKYGKIFKDNYRCNLCFPLKAKNGKMVYKMAQLIEALGIKPWWIKKDGGQNVRDTKSSKTCE